MAVAAIAICRNTLWGSKGYTPQRLADIQVVAHRGGEGCEPENSLSIIRKSLDAEVDAIEIDIRLTLDGQIVVCHDETIDRTTNGCGNISKMTLAQLQRYQLKDKNGTVTDEHIPTLGDVLWLVNGKCRLLIEVKYHEDAERVAKALINEVALYGASRWISVASFDDNILQEIHRLGHPFPLEKLLVFKIPCMPYAIDKGINSFNFRKYDYISSFNIYYATAPSVFVEEIHRRGKKVRIWTVDAPYDTPTLDVDGVITDKPTEWLKR